MSQRATKTDRVTCASLLIIVVLYFSQETITTSAILGRILLVLIYGISFSYLIKMTISSEKFHRIMKLFILFLILNFFGYLFSNDYLEFNIFKNVFLNFLPFFPFYYFARNNILTSKEISVVFFVLFPIFIIQFYQSTQNLKLDKFNDDYIVNNKVYLFIGLLPFVFLIKNRIIAILSLMLTWFYIVQSAKRAAVLIGLVSFLLFVFYNFRRSDTKNEMNGLVRFSLISGAIILGYRFFSENDFLITRMNEMLDGDSSGRDVIAKEAFQKWYNSGNVVNYLFGFGYNSVLHITGHVSHNDWLDMIVSYGIFGLFLYSSIYIVLIQEILSKDWIMEKNRTLILLFSIAVITSMTSRWYWSNFAYTQMIILPYLLATKNKQT